MSLVKAIKRPKWKTANGPKILKEMGLTKVSQKRENQRIADCLIERGFEFWDHCCIYDYNDFNGYTITFRKTTESNDIIWFNWHWVNEGHVYWTGEMSATLNLNPKMKTIHPYCRTTIDYITSDTLHLLERYEGFLRRSILTNYPHVKSVSFIPEVE